MHTGPYPALPHENAKLLSRIEELRRFVEDRSRAHTLHLEINTHLELLNERGEVEEERFSHNTICTAGKDLVLLAADAKRVMDFRWIAIGTSTTAASASDTALVAEIARASAALTNPTPEQLQIRYTFAAGSGSGMISESALDSDASATFAILARQVFTALDWTDPTKSLRITWTVS